MLSTLQAEIDGEVWGSAVTLAGYVDDPAPYYRAADLLLMTSRFEGVPAVIGEALSHGLPFVATDCSTWLTRLACEHPALGTVIATRDPDALAAAVLAQTARPAPSVAQIEAGIDAHRIGPAARAYLYLFDALL
jgi:glycosyltransferase involved in cell wall biosynthesis